MLRFSTVPNIATSTPQSAGEVPPATSPEASKKRSREVDDDGDKQGGAKDADPKPTSSLKREREGDEGGDGQGAAKKVDVKDGAS